jgi:cytochrome c biogenesis protein CcdA
MSLLIASFIAGLLTVAAPCILPLLPIVVGGSISADDNNSHRPGWQRPVVVALSLSLSVITFTLLLKASTALLGVSPQVWRIISGVIVIGLAISYIFPRIYSKASSNRLIEKANETIASNQSSRSLKHAALTGVALGPVFNSCSPTYLLIVAAVLPVSLGEGIVYLVSYAIGLGLALLAIALLGQRLLSKISWITDRRFELALGVVFLLVGIAVLFGFDQQLQTYILDQGWYAPISGLETSLRN